MLESLDLPGTDLRVTRAGLGGCPLGGHGWGAFDEREAERAVVAACDSGINLFDTADCYGLGRSEHLLSRALGRRRSEVVIATKAGVRWDAAGRVWKDASPGYLRRAVEASLRRLRVEQVGVCFLHWPDGETPVADSIGALADLQREGKIGAIGVSNLDRAQLDEALDAAPIVALQLRMSLIHREHIPLARYAATRGVTVWAWGALGEGLLTGKFTAVSTFEPGDRRRRYPEFQGEAWTRNLAIAEDVVATARRCRRSPAQIALRWALDKAGASITLFGAKRSAQVRDNLGCLGWSL